ncbi:hypothetical protein AK812_SmicGene17339 [Symbiodinium microadriaticum]|uniref:Uncharacterized protein n=1 Tax=Symbiodinium microadriaticum TaxID=2951 RepID=A0A1Q9DXY4_SYMMI|nr:hypothetical protein AK812_SmicGene17339 [Symbiodinium microadriaticum]
MAAKKKAQAPPPSPVRRKEDEGTYRYRRAAFARARKSLDRIRTEATDADEPLTAAGEKVRGAFASMRKGVHAALMLKRVVEVQPSGSRQMADAGNDAGTGLTVGRLLRRGSRDSGDPQTSTSFGSILPEDSLRQRKESLGCLLQGEVRQGRRPSGHNPLLQLSIFGTRTATTSLEESLESPSKVRQAEKSTARRRRRRKKAADDGSGGTGSEDEDDSKEDGKHRRRRRNGQEEDVGDSDPQEVGQGRSRRRGGRKDRKADHGDDVLPQSPDEPLDKSQEKRRPGRRAGAGSRTSPGEGPLSEDESGNEEDSDSNTDSEEGDYFDTWDGDYPDKPDKRRYLIPNSSEVSLAETVQSSYFLPRCAQKSLRFGQRRSARRPGLELRELEAKGLAKHRGALELEMRDCLLELQAGCDELSDSAVFGWPGKELLRLHRLCRCAVLGLCGVYKELLAAERPRTPLGLLQEQAQLHEMLRVCRKAARRVAELRRLCQSKDWKWLKTEHGPWEQLSAPIASPRPTVRANMKMRPEKQSQDASPRAAEWHTASVESLDRLQNSIGDWSKSLTGSTESLRTWNDDFRLFPRFCQDTLQEAKQSRNRWSQERERLSLCGPYQTGQCSGRCPHGLQHRCVHCRGRHPGKNCNPAKVSRSVEGRPSRKPARQTVSEARRGSGAGKPRSEPNPGASASPAPKQKEQEELEVLGRTDQRHLQAELIKRANQAVKSLMLLLARLPSAARVDDFPRLAAFVRSFEEQPKAAKSQAMQGDTRLQHLPFHLARGMSRM